MTFPLGVWCYAIATVASVISVAFLLVGAFPGAALGLIAAGGFGWFGWRIMHMRLSLFDDSAEIQQLLRKHTLARADISSFSAGNGGLTTFFTRTVIANLADRSIPIHAFMRSCGRRWRTLLTCKPGSMSSMLGSAGTPGSGVRESGPSDSHERRHADHAARDQAS